jgi:thioredoxin reductase
LQARVSRVTRVQEMLAAEDFAGAARESEAVLEVLPELAEVARMRGRALLDPMLDKIIVDGAAVDGLDFQDAYESFRLAAVMDPENDAEAREQLARIRKLCADQPAGGETGGDAPELQKVIETDGKEVKLRFDVGTRVECNTGREYGWDKGTVVGLFHSEADWPAGEVVPYQVRLDDDTLIYTPVDADACVRLPSSDGLDADVIVVGAGASGIGCAVSLTRDFGLASNRVLVLDRGDAIGATFRAWPDEMRFISPSFNQQGWTSSFDLNAVAHDTSPAYTLHAQHPSGAQYADYLHELANEAKLHVMLRAEVLRVERVDGDFEVRARDGAGHEKMLRARFVVWAAGEFQYPRELSMPGAEHCIHNSCVRSWAQLEGDEHVIIGGYESGVDAAVNLAKAGKRSTVLASTATWNVQTPDPSTELAPYTVERLREVTAADFAPSPRLLAPLRALRVECAPEGGFNVVAEWRAAEPERPEWSLRTPFEGAVAPGAEGSELVVHATHPPVLCTGFEGSVAAVARNLFDFADDSEKGCLSGAPLLTDEDESTKVPGVFLVGPSVVHGDLSFCFVYKFRQRFGIVADAICRGLGRDTKAEVLGLRRANMFLDDLACCENTCGEVC